MRWLMLTLFAYGSLWEPAHAVGTVLAAGDIAFSGSGKELTAQILDAHPSGIVLTLGDNAYLDGTLSEFTNRYHPTWGRHVARTFPSVGNHDYQTIDGAGYDSYFRANGRPIGELGKHWHSFDYAGWHFVALNSNCDVVGCAFGSEQAAWLEADLSESDADCTIAYWHHPRFSSGSEHGSNTATQDLWEVLHNHAVDVVLTGHDHNYERFAPQDALGNADPTGPREFVVGTGGGSRRAMGSIAPNSEASAGNLYGVLALTLREASYDWSFLPAAGYSYTDGGTAACVGVGPTFDPSRWGCGLGPELALVFPLLALARRRRRTP